MKHKIWVMGCLALFAACSESDGDEGTGDTSGDTGGDTGGDTANYEGCTRVVEPSAGNDQTNVQTAFVEAGDGDVICLGAGTFTFNAELSVDSPNLTIRGMGMDATLLDFSGQDAGANGIKAGSDGITFEDFKLLDSPGDGIRVDDAVGVTFRRVWVSWTAEESLEAGAYGVYPVGCDDVLIEDSKVNGARDAGIYVGQSRNVIVRRNEAWGNVAGIEIENTIDSDVYENHAHDNTSGILVFNLPKLAQYGSRAKIHHNLIENNNVENFGVEGTVVAAVPGGTGIILLACDDNEFHDNTITGNRTAGVLAFTYLAGIFGSYDDPNFDTFAERNYFHNNTFANNGASPIGTLHQVASRVLPAENSPTIVVDGCDVRGEDFNAEGVRNCFADNGDITFTTLDCLRFEDIVTDLAAVECSYPSLPAVEL